MIANLINQYLERLRILNRTEETINLQKIILEDFLTYLKKEMIFDISRVCQKHIENYQCIRKAYRNRYSREDSIKAQNYYLMTVKQFFKFLIHEGILVNDSSKTVEYQKQPHILPKPALTLKEVKKILNSVDISTLKGYRDRTIFEIFYSSGLRRKELQYIKLNDIDYVEGFIRVTGKGNKERVVPLGKSACHYVETYIKGIRPELLGKNQSDYLFVGRFGGKISRGVFDEMPKLYAKSNGIEKHVTTHTFRRSCATGMIRNNANVMAVKELLGHESMDAINRYVNLTAHDLKKVHDKTHPREKLTKTFT
ncbi:MAG: hypothetical protein ACD_79C00208G0001 [uncultured bacterium]|nr:MAG: hypothetical protein ACD_79C00208G0001 [uncultured bacterium]